MPRKARIDAPIALHHINVRGIEGRRIFFDDQDQDNFISRLGDIITYTETFCFAWALIPNHLHLVLRTGKTFYYNRRHPSPWAAVSKSLQIDSVPGRPLFT